MKPRVLRPLAVYISLLLIPILGPMTDQASAQVRIRIPRPRTEPVSRPTTTAPTTEVTTTTQPATVTTASPTSTSGSPLAPTGIPTSIIIDDGFTFFTLHNKKDYVGGKPLNKGWSLVSDLRMAGPAIPKRSGYKIVVKKGAQPLATARCEGDIPAIPQHEVG